MGSSKSTTDVFCKLTPPICRIALDDGWRCRLPRRSPGKMLTIFGRLVRTLQVGSPFVRGTTLQENSRTRLRRGCLRQSGDRCLGRFAEGLGPKLRGSFSPLPVH